MPMTVAVAEAPISVAAVPLSRKPFAPFGDVVENPRPELQPSSTASSPRRALHLPFNGVSANQGTAIKYQQLSRITNRYDQAPSGQPGLAVVHMFVCAARARLACGGPATAFATATATATATEIYPVANLERHPFTSQTFVPLARSRHDRYLVVVAPSLPPPLPGRACAGGLPDPSHLKAFVATAAQAVTYAAGTWHAPMMALGPEGTSVDFVVMQFANGVSAEDCQEVLLGGAGAEADPAVTVAVAQSEKAAARL